MTPPPPPPQAAGNGRSEPGLVRQISFCGGRRVSQDDNTGGYYLEPQQIYRYLTEGSWGPAFALMEWGL